MNKVDYVCWKSHFQGVLKLHELSFIMTDVALTKISPVTSEEFKEYKNWNKTDQLLLMWIHVTVFASVQALVLHYATAKEIYKVIRQLSVATM